MSLSKKEIQVYVCYITDSSNLNFLGLDFIKELDLFKVPLNSIFNTCQVNSATDTDKHFISILKAKFNNVFQEGLGCCTKVKATLKLKSDSKPIFRPKRPVRYAALATVENELNRLQQSGIIQPINYLSWAAPIVMVEKANCKVRLCADFSTGLNDALDIHNLHRKICSQNSTVELVLQSWTLQMLIYKCKLMKIPKIFSQSISPPSIWRQVCTSNFSTNNKYNARRIARSFRLH